MAAKKDLLVLLLDVGEHMQPYLPLLHRLVFNALNVKLLSKPNHEVAVILYGTKGTRHKLYDASDPLSYLHVTVLRPLQNLSSYLELEPFAFATDAPQRAAAARAAADMDPQALAEAEAALLARVEAAGLACRDAAAVCTRAVRLFGPPGPKADWADGLVVALDVMASALEERFERDKKEANKLGQLKVLLVSNLLAQSEPFEEEFRSALVETCNNRRILLEVACLDHYVPASPASSSAASAENPNPLALLPPALAASRRINLEQLHLLKSELPPAAFRHLRQPAELLCMFRSKEISYQASNAVFMLNPKPLEDQDAAALPGPVAVNVKLYKKIRRAAADEWKTVLEAKPSGTDGARGDGGTGSGALGHGAPGGGDGHDGDAAGDGVGSVDPGFAREVVYEDPTTGEKFSRGDFMVRSFPYGKQFVPIARYNDDYAQVADPEMSKFREKDFSLLGFVDIGGVPHHRLIDEPHVVLGDSPASAVAVASLALTLKASNKAGVVRFLFRKESPQLGLLTPHLSDSADVPHALLLSPLPFAEDIRSYSFSTFRNEQEARDLPRRLAEARGEAPPPPLPAAAAAIRPETEGPSQLSGLALGITAPEPGLRFERLQPDTEQQDAALALVRGLDLGPSLLPGGGGGASCRGGAGAAAAVREPHPEALAPEAVSNPVLQRIYSLVTSRALDPTAQLPDPEDDPLVELVLQPQGRYWPAGSKDVIRRAEEKLQTRERVNGGAAGGPAAKRARHEDGRIIDGGEAGPEYAGAEGGGGGAAAIAASVPRAPAASAAVVFDPTAAGGTGTARVSRVGELTAMEDFRAMLAQGRDSAYEAVRQLQELVRVLVGRSIGDQLYDKAAKCVEALREGCVSTGCAGAFNRFLRDFVEWCKSEDRYAFVPQLVARGVTLISTEDLNLHRRSGAERSVPWFEDDGGGVAPWEARRFLEQHMGPAEEEVEATLPAVVQDEEFEDMD